MNLDLQSNKTNEATDMNKCLENKIFFDDLDLHDDLLDALWDMHFDECTPIQGKCIPLILDKKDLIGIAQTGTGKTAAFLLPILSLLSSEPHPEDAVNCLIMAPTRELARQIDQALQGFAYYLNIRSVAIYGGNDGVRYEQERTSLIKGADIVIATPGRLITHLQLGTLDLSRTTYLVLDEADRILDMGFCDDILKIVAKLPSKRQTILFSATMPPKIENFAKSIMNKPVEVKISIAKPADKIDQCIFLCHESDKMKLVQHIFATEDMKRTILFASSKKKVKELYAMLVKNNINAKSMHSDLDQSQRDETMLAFKAGRVDVLVATDIVARGIDIDDISVVINFETPKDSADYVHRIGRTARAGRKGKSITLVSEKERKSLLAIEKLIGKTIKRNRLPEGMNEPNMTEPKRMSSSIKSKKNSRNRKHFRKNNLSPNNN